MLTKLFAASRYLIIIAVLGSLLAAALVMFFGAFDIFRILVAILQLEFRLIIEHVFGKRQKRSKNKDFSANPTFADQS